MTLETGFIFTIALILLWIKPGPGQAAIITRALNDGFFGGFWIAMGIVTGSVIYFIISAVFAVTAENYIDEIGYVFKLVGALFLFYLGYQGMKDINSGHWKGRQDRLTRKDHLKNYITGLLITLANPLAILFFVGILPTLVPLNDLTWVDIVIGACIVAYVGTIVDSIIAALASQVRATLSDTSFIRKINIVTSIGFVLIGGFLLFSAITNYTATFDI